MSKTRLVILGLVFVALAAPDAKAQLNLGLFGKNKKANEAVMDPKGDPPSWSLFNRTEGTGVMSLQRPGTAVERLNEGTQRMLAETREAVAKPFNDLRVMRLWPAKNNRPARQQFSLLPGWLKNSRPKPSNQAATVGDWLAQPRPE